MLTRNFLALAYSVKHFIQLNILLIQYLYKVLKLFYRRSENTGTSVLLYTTGNISR